MNIHEADQLITELLKKFKIESTSDAIITMKEIIKSIEQGQYNQKRNADHSAWFDSFVIKWSKLVGAE